MSATDGPFWVYILQNPDGLFYVGQTDELDHRIEHHNETVDAAPGFTQKHGPWRLVWKESHKTRGAAVARERQIKRMKSARWIREHLLREAPGC